MIIVAALAVPPGVVAGRRTHPACSSRSRRPPDLRGDVVEEKDLTASFVLGGVMGALALLGLFLAAGAQDDVFYFTGLGLFVFCVLFIFAMIHRHVGR
jgi:hypothetical protein